MSFLDFPLSGALEPMRALFSASIRARNDQRIGRVAAQSARLAASV